MYGAGFLMFSAFAIYKCRWLLKVPPFRFLLYFLIFCLISSLLMPRLATPKKWIAKIDIVGVQMEFPPANLIPKMLNQALAKNTNAQIFVLSEYTLDGAVPDSLKNWCRDNSKFLVVGGKDVVTNHIYYNTAFVVGTNSEIVFKQAKSVPI